MKHIKYCMLLVIASTTSAYSFQLQDLEDSPLTPIIRPGTPTPTQQSSGPSASPRPATALRLHSMSEHEELFSEDEDENSPQSGDETTRGMMLTSQFAPSTALTQLPQYAATVAALSSTDSKDNKESQVEEKKEASQPHSATLSPLSSEVSRGLSSGYSTPQLRKKRSTQQKIVINQAYLNKENYRAKIREFIDRQLATQKQLEVQNASLQEILKCVQVTQQKQDEQIAKLTQSLLQLTTCITTFVQGNSPATLTSSIAQDKKS